MLGASCIKLAWTMSAASASPAALRAVSVGLNLHHGSNYGASCFPLRFMSAQPERVSLDEGPIAQEGFDKGFIAPHPGMKDLSPERNVATLYRDVQTVMSKPVYTNEYLESVHPKHLKPSKFYQQVGQTGVTLMRSAFDRATGYGPDMNEKKWLQRILFLETVAGVPGMVAGMLRHLRSLRTMQHDHGWINTLLQEAENERMHLLTFMQMRQPGIFFRGMVLLAQGVFFNAYFIAYLLSPKTCHAFVGYLEEEAVKTYTHCLRDIDAGKVWKDVPAPEIARVYWDLPPNATMRDLVLAVRADEACHSHVNHTLSSTKSSEPCPFGVGTHMVP